MFVKENPDRKKKIVKIKADIAEDCQNDNLLIGYQLLVFLKDLKGRRRSCWCLYGHDIHYFEDATPPLTGLNFVGIKFRGFRQNRDIKSERKLCNFCCLMIDIALVNI